MKIYGNQNLKAYQLTRNTVCRDRGSSLLGADIRFGKRMPIEIDSDKLINAMQEALGDSKASELLCKAGIDDIMKDGKIAFYGDDFSRYVSKLLTNTLNDIVDIPVRFVNAIAKPFNKNQDLGGIIGKRLQQAKNREAFEAIEEIVRQYQKNGINGIEGGFDYEKAGDLFKNELTSKIIKIDKNYKSRDERPLNRLVTSTVSALYSANDFYNLSMLQKDDKDEAKKAHDARFAQEAKRMVLSAGMTYLSLSLFKGLTKNIVGNAAIIAGSTLISEVISRISSKTPLKPLTAKEAEKIAKRNKAPQEVKTDDTHENKNVSFKANLKDEKEIFGHFIDNNPYASQNVHPTQNAQSAQKKKSNALKIFLGIFAALNVLYLGKRWYKNEFKQTKKISEFISNNFENIKNNNIDTGMKNCLDNVKKDTTKLDDLIENLQTKHGMNGKNRKLIFLKKLKSAEEDVMSGDLKKKIFKKEAELDLDKLEARITKLKDKVSQMPDGEEKELLDKVLKSYKLHIDATSPKHVGGTDNKITIKENKAILPDIYNGVTKAFRTVYDILTIPAFAITNTIKKNILSKSGADRPMELFELVKKQAKPDYSEELAKLAKIVGLEGDISDADAQKCLHEIYRSISNFEGGAETGDLANLSRTMVTAISTYFFVNDYRNKVLIESEGKDVDGAKEETKERLMHKVSNFIINGTLMNTFNSVFRKQLNNSLLGAAVVAAATETTNEFLVRKSICQPVKKKNSKQEIIDFEEKQLSKKGFMGWWARTFKKLTGKKTLTQKAGINKTSKTQA